MSTLLVATSAALLGRGRQRDKARRGRWNLAGVCRSRRTTLKYLSSAQGRRGVVQMLRVLITCGVSCVSARLLNGVHTEREKTDASALERWGTRDSCTRNENRSIHMVPPRRSVVCSCRASAREPKARGSLCMPGVRALSLRCSFLTSGTLSEVPAYKTKWHTSRRVPDMR